jgi:predicted phosphoribosyltransferase
VAGFRDRADGGRRLADSLAAYRDRPGLLVLGLPRGGVPVAYEVARALGAPLDVLVVRKLGVPGHEELAMGAVASGGVTVFNQDVVRRLGLAPEVIDRAVAEQSAEVARRERAWRGDRPRPRPEVTGRTVILVDDGLATGATMRAGLVALRREGPAWLVAAAPVAARETVDDLGGLADDVVCAVTPAQFWAVGYWYDDFRQTTDDEVADLLARASPVSRHGRG